MIKIVLSFVGMKKTEPMPDFSFRKNERLKSRKTIGMLFKSGSSFGVYPLRAVWQVGQNSGELGAFQVAVSVPKKKFRKAVDRNRLRRQVKEAYRLHRNQLDFEVLPSVSLMILYTGVEALPYAVIDAAMVRMLRKLQAALRESK